LIVFKTLRLNETGGAVSARRSFGEFMEGTYRALDG
jgi:hypothetical protein